MKKVLPLFAALSLLACVSTPGRSPQVEIPVDSVLAVATFDTAWTVIRRTYYDSTFRGLDWNAVRAELRPRAGAARTVGELRATLGAMLARMGESHFGLIPSEVVAATARDRDDDDAGATPGDVGIEIRVVDRAALVWRVDSAGPAFATGVRTGWILESVGDFRVAPSIALAAGVSGERDRAAAMRLVGSRAEARLHGDPGSTVKARFRDRLGYTVHVRMVRRREPGTISRFGNLPAFNVTLARSRLPSARGCVGYVRFNIWLTPINPPLDSAMQELADCRGIILDLRGNPGGIAGLSMGVAGYFIDSVVPLGILKTRGNELRLVTNPRRVSLSGRSFRVYDGPLAILVDAQSVSTSEIFAGGMQYLKRARVFGESTPGQALPASLTRLPNNDVLMHVFSDYTLPDGTRLEVRGVIPDQVEPIRRSDLLAGRDAALAAAVTWIETH